MFKKIFSVAVLKRIFYFSIAVKIFFALFVGLHEESGKPEISFFTTSHTINIDELASGHVAFNYNNGLGFSDSLSSFNYGPHRLKKTAYRPTFPIVVHIFFQRIYSHFSLLRAGDTYNMHSQYYNTYAWVVIIFSLGLFLLSIHYFKNLILKITDKENVQYLVTIIYLLHPASLIYVGLYPLYENIVLPLLVISISKLTDLLYLKRPKTKADLLIIPVLITLASLLRPHILISMLLVIIYLSLLALFKFKDKKYLTITVATVGIVLCMALSHGLIVYKNYKRIGKAVLSTEASQAFFYGHHPYTRGCWNGDSETPGSLTYEYRKKNIPELEHMSEAELYDAHTQLAWKWIKENPKKEAELVVRKIALSFLPYNYDNLHFNIIIFFIHLGFLGFCFVLALKVKAPMFYSPVLILSFLIVLGSLLLSIYAFFDYRYTYYAQPFMMLLATFFYLRVELRIKHRLKVKNIAITK